MKETLPCPGCHTELTPEATGCHICMRARTKQEIVRGYAKLREEQARRKRRPFQIMATVLVVGAGSWLVVRFQVPLMTVARSGKARAAAWFDRFTDTNTYAPEKATETASETTPPVAPVTKSPFAPVLTPPAELELRNARPAAPIVAAPATPLIPAKPPVPKNSWVVTGTVYDVDNLEPAKNATISFTRDTLPKVVVKTDDNGEYEAVLAKGEGWTALVEVRNRRRGQVADLEPPYRTRDEDERRAAFDHISDGDLAPAAVAGNLKSAKVHMDFVTFPNYWSSSPALR